MSKRTERRINRLDKHQPLMSARDEPSGRQDPVADYIMRRLGTGSRLLGEVLMEVRHLQTLGVELTLQIAERLVDSVEEADRRRHRVVPVTHPPTRGPQKKRRPSGRFSRIEVVGPVVYYMRIGNRVKIGTSTNLRERLETINPEELLAVERGDATKERMRHEQFAALRTHGEWFRLEGALVEHIESIREAHG